MKVLIFEFTQRNNEFNRGSKNGETSTRTAIIVVSKETDPYEIQQQLFKLLCDEQPKAPMTEDAVEVVEQEAISRSTIWNKCTAQDVTNRLDGKFDVTLEKVDDKTVVVKELEKDKLVILEEHHTTFKVGNVLW